MLIIEKKPKSIPAESYRTLRTNIKYSGFDKEIKKILITSSEQGEGKSTTAANLALAFSKEGKKVVLIDCDLRKPQVHRIFQVSNRKGISDILIDKKNIGKGTVKYDKYLDIITSGKIPPNPAEMLSSNAMEELLNELDSKYDYIIIDSPPLTAVTDGQILSTKADGTILVVKAGQTKKEAILASKQLLDKVNAKIIGTVLNRVEMKKEKYYSYYGE